MVPPGIVFIILEEGGFVMSDGNEVKASECTRHREPIQAWKFHPIIVPSIEVSLVFHPTFNE
jgi:hypothetical protein